MLPHFNFFPSPLHVNTPLVFWNKILVCLIEPSPRQCSIHLHEALSKSMFLSKDNNRSIFTSPLQVDASCTFMSSHKFMLCLLSGALFRQIYLRTMSRNSTQFYFLEWPLSWAPWTHPSMFSPCHLKQFINTYYTHRVTHKL